MQEECFECGKPAYLRANDGRWYCGPCYAPLLPHMHTWPLGNGHVRCLGCGLEALMIRGHVYKTLKQMELGLLEDR